MKKVVNKNKKVGSSRSSRNASLLARTYEMVDDPSTDSMISWSESGKSFIVWNRGAFSRFILPHSCRDFASFTQSLANFGFRKVGSDRWEFADVDFVRGQPELIEKIYKRPDEEEESRLRTIAIKRFMKWKKNFNRKLRKSVLFQLERLQI